MRNVMTVLRSALASHNISFRDALRLGKRLVTLVPRTDVLTLDLSQEVLRQQMIQSPFGRRQPLYLSNAFPTLLERLCLIDSREVEGAAVREVEARPHARMVAP